MAIFTTRGVLVDDIPLSVITAREPVKDNQWITERWRVVGAVAGNLKDSERIERSLLRASDDGEQYLWTGFRLHLHENEADAYYYNIVGQNPSLYVYCEMDAEGEPRPRSITAEYIDAMAHLEFGNATYPVPMPPEVYRCIEQYVVQHYTPEEPKLHRKHERRGAGGVPEDE